MGAANLFVHNVSILLENWILNFIKVIDISGWLSSLQFSSDGD